MTSGRFLNPETSGDNYFEAKGIPRHRDERQMGHYFDFQSWQDEQNARKALQAQGAPRTRPRPYDRGGFRLRSLPLVLF